MTRYFFDTDLHDAAKPQPKKVRHGLTLFIEKYTKKLKDENRRQHLVNKEVIKSNIKNRAEKTRS